MTVRLSLIGLILTAFAAALVASAPKAAANPLPAFASVTAGGGHTCALTDVGGVKCWGFNDAGQLGDGTTTSRMSPAPIASERTFVAVRAGPDVTCGLTTTIGMILCWGGGLGSLPVPLGDPR